MATATRRTAVVATGGNGMHASGPLRRECPKCGAKPGYRCWRLNVQGGQPQRAVKVHTERRQSRAA